MADREVFDNAPLRLVALEIKFPVTSQVLTRQVWDAFESALGEELPEVTVLVDDPDTHVPTAAHDPVLRRTSEPRKRAVTLHPGAVTVELADYRQYSDLHALATLTLQGVAAATETFKCTEIGLRYINEVPAADALAEKQEWARPAAWEPFVNAELLKSVTDMPDGLCAFGYRGVLMFHTDDHAGILVRLEYGPAPMGLVEPKGALALDEGPGPCFGLDIDGHVFGTSAEPVATNPEEVLGLLTELHAAVDKTFQWAITERLKDEVLRGGRAHNRAQDVGEVQHAVGA